MKIGSPKGIVRRLRLRRGLKGLFALPLNQVRLALITVLLLAGLSWSLCLAAGVSENQVKAAFLFNFVKFAEWPAAAFAGPESPIVILVAGHDAAANEIDTLKGKMAQGRKVTVRRVSEIPEGERFHVLFVCRNENALPMLRSVRSKGVLTVSDGRQFSRSGGMIGLVTLDDRVSFEINVTALERAGLKLNSQVLKLAKIVKDQG